MDNEKQLKLAALMRLRKELQDKSPDQSVFRDSVGTNLASPEEYQQMPNEVKNPIYKDAVYGNQGFNIGAAMGMEGGLEEAREKSALAERMAQEIQNDSGLTEGGTFRDDDGKKHLRMHEFEQAAPHSRGVYAGESSDMTNHYRGDLMPYIEPERFERIKNMLGSTKKDKLRVRN
jgi:hypothetical protein